MHSDSPFFEELSFSFCNRASVRAEILILGAGAVWICSILRCPPYCVHAGVWQMAWEWARFSVETETWTCACEHWL